MPKKMHSLRFSERTWNQLGRIAKRFQVEDRTRAIEILAEREDARMFIVKFDDGEIQEFETTVQAEQAVQDYLLNSDAESAELEWNGEVVAEYSKDEFKE